MPPADKAGSACIEANPDYLPNGVTAATKISKP
jgi:hypothetical protein